MNPDNVTSIMISGPDLERILFKSAFYYAEEGLKVWFISPRSFERLPENVTPPDKDVLKLITFLYLEDYKDVINHINDIHSWRHLPNIIILNSYEHYCCLTTDFDTEKAAIFTSLLLDAVSTCSHKNSKPSLFLAYLNDKAEHVLSCKMKTLMHLYFGHVLEHQDLRENDCTLDSIIRLTDLFKV